MAVISATLRGRRLATAVVFEDALTFAFLDKHPINRGHTLVIPKEHQPNFYDLPDDSYHALMATVKRLAKVIHDKLRPKKVGLIVAGWKWRIRTYTLFRKANEQTLPTRNYPK